MACAPKRCPTPECLQDLFVNGQTVCPKCGAELVAYDFEISDEACDNVSMVQCFRDGIGKLLAMKRSKICGD